MLPKQGKAVAPKRVNCLNISTSQGDIKYTLIYSARRSLALIVRSSGAVEIRAPFGTCQETIEKFLASKTCWLKKHLTRLTSVERSDPLPETPELEQRRARIFTEQYALACERFGMSADEAPRLRWRSMRTQWGSYSAKTHRICLNSRLIEAPVEAIRMVCVHELCHVSNLHHDKAFYRAMDRYQDPHWRDVKEQLERRFG